MSRLHRVLLALVVPVLVFGTALAAGVAFDATGFDGFEEDEGYVDLMLEDDVLTIVFDEVEGAIPAMMEGDSLPLDEDFEDERLTRADSLALYGGLPVGTTPNTVIIEVDGSAPAIREALMARLAEYQIESSECFEGGPVCTYELSKGDMHWLMSFTPHGAHSTLYLQALR